MGSPSAPEKPEAPQTEAKELETVKSVEGQELESGQTAAELQQTGSKDGKAEENPTPPEQVIEKIESNEEIKMHDPEEEKDKGAKEVKEGESAVPDVQLDDIAKSTEEKSKAGPDTTKPITKNETAEQQKENVALVGSKPEDAAPAAKVETNIVSEETTDDINETNEPDGQGPAERKDYGPSGESKEQKASRAQGDNSADAEDAMDIDTALAKPGLEQNVPADSKGVPTGADEKKTDKAESGKDVSPNDAMEIDSKPDEVQKTPQETKEDEHKLNQNTEGEAANKTSAEEKEAPTETQGTAQDPEQNSAVPQHAEKKTMKSTSTEDKTANEAAKSAERQQEVADRQMEDKQVKEEEKLSKDTEDIKQSIPTRPRRSSTRNTYPTRTLRPRTSGRVNNTGGVSETPAGQDTAPKKPSAGFGSSPLKNPISSPEPEEGIADEDDTPGPTMEAKGLVMRVDDAVFVTEDQLDELKIARLTDKKVRPFEQLTFQDLRTYNRDQLRAYCFAYGMARRKKTEMEADMARYLSYWNKGREGFALHEYVPTSSRVLERVEATPTDSVGSVKGAPTAQAGSASREGSTTPTTSNGKASASAKPSSSRGATPSRSGGPAVNSGKVSASQGSSALSSASPTGGPAATGSSQAPGSTQTGTQRPPSVTTRAAKPTTVGPVLPRGFGTSFKQRVHARQAGTKFKSAYNGAGPAIVNIVENAAAFFEGKDSPEVILDQAKSYERYQFNVDMLNEIFDGVPDDSDEGDGDVEMTETEANADTNDAATSATPAKAGTGHFKKTVLENIASRVASGKRKAQVAELNDLEKQFKEMEECTKYTERTNMRLFQRLERAETKEQIESVKQEFEAMHNVKLDDCNPPPLVRRKLNKTLPPLIMPDEKCRILRFKVS